MTPLNLTQKPNNFLIPGQKGSSGMRKAQRPEKNINKTYPRAAHKSPQLIAFKGKIREKS